MLNAYSGLHCGLLKSEETELIFFEVYNIVNGLSNLPASTFFEFRTDTRTRGHSLPSSVLEATSVNSFKDTSADTQNYSDRLFMETSAYE